MARAVGVLYVPGAEYMYGCGHCRTLSVFEDDEYASKQCANAECRHFMALPENKAHWVPWTGTPLTTWAQWVEARDRAAQPAPERDFSYRRSLTPLETPHTYNSEGNVFGSSIQNLPDCIYNEAGQGFPKNVRQLTWIRYHDPDIRPKKGIPLGYLEKVLGFAFGQLGDYGVRLDGLWVLFERHKGRGYSTVKVGTHEEMVRAMPDDVYALYLNDTERTEP